jgi:hypothetical protein
MRASKTTDGINLIVNNEVRFAFCWGGRCPPPKETGRLRLCCGPVRKHLFQELREGRRAEWVQWLLDYLSNYVI